jgi:TonB-dependent starch-binding outer membrane protein SusC
MSRRRSCRPPAGFAGRPPRALAAFAWALALALAIPAGAAAQGTLTGRVLEAETRRPLTGVQVSIPAAGLGTVTNAEGRYLIAGVSAGEVLLRVQMLGYGTQQRTVSVSAGESAVADFQLETEALGLDEIVVTGTAGGQQRRAIGNVVGSLDVEEKLARSAPASVQQMLSGQVAGVNIQVGGGNVGSGGNIVIRGMNTVALGSGPLVYVDGIRVNGGTATSPIGQ